MRDEVRWTTGGQVCLTLHQRPALRLVRRGEYVIVFDGGRKRGGLSGPDNFRSGAVGYRCDAVV